jgi:photosystem II stability/assembly factor-like uncharacterized protein
MRDLAPGAESSIAWATGTVDGGGAILGSRDAGRSWSVVQISPGSANAARGLSFVDARSGWVVGYDAIESTRDGGASWTSQRANVVGLERTPLLEAVAFADRSVGIAVGSVRGEPDPTSVYPLVLVTADGGATWARRLLPAIEGLSFALRDVCLASSGVALATGLGFSGEVGLVSRDAGSSWNVIPAIGATYGAGAVDCADGTNLWIASVGPTGEIRLLTSSDGGQSFSDGTSRVADSPFAWMLLGDPLAGSGATLQRVSLGATFGVAIGIDESDVRDTRGVVVRSDDGGRTWSHGELPEGTSALHDVVVADAPASSVTDS